MIFNNKRYIKLLINRIYIIFICFCHYNTCENQKKENIFILIHGTWVYSFYSLLFSSFEKSEIETRWENTKNKIAEKIGLIDITNLDNNEDYLKREEGIIEYKKQNNKFYENTRYYKYNWDGFLSEKNRNKAAKILAKEITLIKKKFPYSKIHIIGYSHGGNVALNMIKYLPKNNNLIIDELILLATPIGRKSELLANKKNYNKQYFFKQIYCLYSLSDYTQIKDIMFNFPYLCRRYLTIRNTHIRHIECKYEFYNKKNQKTITYNPNHKDFWIFNENNLIEKDLYHYFPVIYHLPTIINSLTQLNPQLPSSQNIHQNCKLPLKKLFITKNNHEKK